MQFEKDTPVKTLPGTESYATFPSEISFHGHRVEVARPCPLPRGAWHLHPPSDLSTPRRRGGVIRIRRGAAAAQAFNVLTDSSHKDHE